VGEVIKLKNKQIHIYFNKEIIFVIEDPEDRYEKYELVFLLNKVFTVNDFIRWKPKNVLEEIVKNMLYDQHRSYQYTIERELRFIAGILDNQDIFQIQHVFRPK